MYFLNDHSVTTNRIINGLDLFGYIEMIKMLVAINRKSIFWAACYYSCLVNGLILICPLLYFADFKYPVQSATKYFIKSVIFRSLKEEPDVAIFGGN
ncbi:MAG: hypothetical protein ACI9DO_003500 [Reinekea sp.]|jgi:hypothetical protein